MTGSKRPRRRVGRKSTLTDDEIAEIVSMHRDDGLGCTRISRVFDEVYGHEIPPGRIEYWLNARGAATRVPGKSGRRGQSVSPYYRNGTLVTPFTPAEDARMLAMLNAGMKPAHVAERMGRPTSSVARRIDANACRLPEWRKFKEGCHDG